MSHRHLATAAGAVRRDSRGDHLERAEVGRRGFDHHAAARLFRGVRVPDALDEVPKPVVVAALQAGRGRHGHDHRPFPQPRNSSMTTGSVRHRDDNSRAKVQIVRGNNSAGPHKAVDGIEQVAHPFRREKRCRSRRYPPYVPAGARRAFASSERVN